MTVYVIKNHSIYDVSKAAKFGNIRFILSRYEEVDNGPHIIQTIREALDDFNSDRDYLLLIGSPLAISVVSAIVWDFIEPGKTLQYLIWDKVDMEYKVTTVAI